MSILNQKTLKKEVKFEGVGLHTGKKVSIRILPSKPNTGIVFKRVDLEKNNIVLPNVYNVSNATLCTTITNEHGVSVSTIEHLMGALYGLGIDNALIEINSQEVPIMDGSAKIFVENFLEIGFQSSDVPIKLIKITNKVTINIKFLFFREKFPKTSVTLDLFCSFIAILSSEKILRREGNKVKEIINEVINPKVIIHPKSIIGFISLKTKDKKANTVVKTV